MSGPSAFAPPGLDAAAAELYKLLVARFLAVGVLDLGYAAGQTPGCTTEQVVDAVAAAIRHTNVTKARLRDLPAAAVVGALKELEAASPLLSLTVGPLVGDAAAGQDLLSGGAAGQDLLSGGAPDPDLLRVYRAVAACPAYRVDLSGLDVPIGQDGQEILDVLAEMLTSQVDLRELTVTDNRNIPGAGPGVNIPGAPLEWTCDATSNVWTRRSGRAPGPPAASKQDRAAASLHGQLATAPDSVDVSKMLEAAGNDPESVAGALVAANIPGKHAVNLRFVGVPAGAAARILGEIEGRTSAFGVVFDYPPELLADASLVAISDAIRVGPTQVQVQAQDADGNILIKNRHIRSLNRVMMGIHREGQHHDLGFQMVRGAGEPVDLTPELQELCDPLDRLFGLAAADAADAADAYYDWGGGMCAWTRSAP